MRPQLDLNWRSPQCKRSWEELRVTTLLFISPSREKQTLKFFYSLRIQWGQPWYTFMAIFNAHHNNTRNCWGTSIMKIYSFLKRESERWWETISLSVHTTVEKNLRANNCFSYVKLSFTIWEAIQAWHVSSPHLDSICCPQTKKWWRVPNT